MNINIGVNSAYLNRVAQPAQDRGIIIIGGKSGGAQKDAPATVFDRVALNPQPLPPKPGPDPGPYLKNNLANAFNRVALNPQPLPPKEAIFTRAFNGLDSVSLNAQPLPPKPQPDPGPYANYALRMLLG